jgi:hypothetical protein
MAINNGDIAADNGDVHFNIGQLPKVISARKLGALALRAVPVLGGNYFLHPL